MLNFFREDNGNLSSNRLVFVLFGMVVLAVWAYASVLAKVPMTLPDSIVNTLLGLAASKTIQKLFEK